MLKVRVIPCLDVKGGRVVKGVNFVNLVDAGDPVEQATIYDREGADEVQGSTRHAASPGMLDGEVLVAGDSKGSNVGLVPG